MNFDPTYLIIFGVIYLGIGLIIGLGILKKNSPEIQEMRTYYINDDMADFVFLLVACFLWFPQIASGFFEIKQKKDK